MAFREVRDAETGELIVKFDPERDDIQYRRRDGAVRIEKLAPYREAAKAAPPDAARLTPRRTMR